MTTFLDCRAASLDEVPEDAVAVIGIGGATPYPKSAPHSASAPAAIRAASLRLAPRRGHTEMHQDLHEHQAQVAQQPPEGGARRTPQQQMIPDQDAVALRLVHPHQSPTDAQDSVADHMRHRQPRVADDGVALCSGAEAPLGVFAVHVKIFAE